MKIQPTQSTNFKALPIAKAEVIGLEGKYKLFKIMPDDIDYLKNYVKDINLPEIAEGFSKEEYNNWYNVIEKGLLFSGKEFGREGILCAYNNKPCGVLNYSIMADKRSSFVNYAATWTSEKGKKVPLANQIMFFKLFRNLSEKGGCNVRLNALINSPYCPVMKYKTLGFASIGSDFDGLENMKINEPRIIKSLENLAKKIKLTDINTKEEVNIKKELDLTI